MTPEQRKLVIAYKQVFAGEFGDTVMKDLSLKCREKALTYVTGDPYETAFREGMRAVVTMIRNTLEMKVEEQGHDTAITQESFNERD